MASAVGWAITQILSTRLAECLRTRTCTDQIYRKRCHRRRRRWSVCHPATTPRPESNAPTDEPEAGQKEVFTSWALSILITLLIVALFTSYILQTRKIQAVHETVLSIVAGTWGTGSLEWLRSVHQLANGAQVWSLASSCG